MKISEKQIEKFREGLRKSVEDKKAFVEHFSKGGTVETFKPKEKRTVVGTAK